MVVERQRDTPKGKEQDETEPQTVVPKNWNGQENITDIKRSRYRRREPRFSDQRSKPHTENAKMFSRRYQA